MAATASVNTGHSLFCGVMAIGTRGVLAIGAVVLLAIGVAASVSGRKVLASKIMAAAFGVATIWSIMSIAWASSHQTGIGVSNFIALASMAATATVYYAYKGANDVPFTSRL